MSDLKKQTLRGIAFLGLGKSAGRIISFVNTLILARLLSPEDYGLMAMAMVVAGFVGFFNDIGLGSAIIQRKVVTKAQLSGVFYIAIVISIVLYICVFFSASMAAEFYGNPSIEALLQVITLGFLLGAIKSVPDALLVKEMRFKIISGVEFISIILQCIVTLILAYLGYKTWSLVYGLLAAQLFKTVSLMWLSGWLPDRKGNVVQAFDLMKFGVSVTYSRVTWYIYTNAQTLILGKITGEKSTGVYSMAQTIAELPTAHITNLIVQVASPLFAKLQDNYTALNNALLKLSAGISLITFPVLVGIMLTANELVPILLGSQWDAVIVPLQLLCIMGVFKSIDPLLTQALISIGRADITARYTTVCAIIIPSAVIVGANLSGIIGASIALAVTYPFLVLYLLWLAKRHFELPIVKYLALFITPFSGCLTMALMLFGVEHYILPFFQLDSVLLTLIFKVIVGMLTYFLWIVYIRTDGVILLKGVLTDLGISEKKLNRWPFNLVVTNA
ncbi:lipopolysaccharide biosynthesis protein [Colwellia psychrerythraea]|uniref:Polysaccharide biosynthesis protein n=1 Tax=Colwellia psychrerythraea TaxID=28229 RepID=A0A099KXX1_COLPS|nr:lipopolysaccharide biosynthesis protein [Colwellia psychrerythraea]KGJ94702.1 polysaccharide biosynthesis protein [Colwellia psychrerythraea]